MPAQAASVACTLPWTLLSCGSGVWMAGDGGLSSHCQGLRQGEWDGKAAGQDCCTLRTDKLRP